jgi:hypothetical protein
LGGQSPNVGNSWGYLQNGWQFGGKIVIAPKKIIIKKEEEERPGIFVLIFF